MLSSYWGVNSFGKSLYFHLTGIDFEVGHQNLTFQSNTFQGGMDIDFIIEYDELVEGHEVVYLSLTQPVITGLDHPDGAVLGAIRSTVVIITDDDGEYISTTLKIFY